MLVAFVDCPLCGISFLCVGTSLFELISPAGLPLHKSNKSEGHMSSPLKPRAALRCSANPIFPPGTLGDSKHQRWKGILSQSNAGCHPQQHLIQRHWWPWCVQNCRSVPITQCWGVVLAVITLLYTLIFTMSLSLNLHNSPSHVSQTGFLSGTGAETELGPQVSLQSNTCKSKGEEAESGTGSHHHVGLRISSLA